MQPNYYHETLDASGGFSYETPGEGKIEVINNMNVTRITYPTGDELVQIIHNGRVDLYASFPIKVTHND